MNDPTFKVSVSGYALNRKIPLVTRSGRTLTAPSRNKTLSCLELADSVRTGHPFTTWHHHHWRTSANYDQGSTSPSTSTLRITDPHYPFYARSTLSPNTPPSCTQRQSTPRPQSRVVFLLDTPIMQTKNYIAGRERLLWLNGTADRRCKDPFDSSTAAVTVT